VSADTTPVDPGAAHAALIERFYAALGRRDAQAMIACYHRTATFGDPVFPALDRDRLIVRHRDRFDLRRWLAQALGAKGALLGFLPAVQRATRARAAKTLADWRAREKASALRASVASLNVALRLA
jgi:hypothetical protein